MSKLTIGVLVFSVLIAFCMGGAVGSVHMKWTVNESIRKSNENNRDARICWEALYVAQKNRCSPGTCPGYPAPNP